MTAPRAVIVTGAAGTLGRAVVAAFAGLGDRVARIDLAALDADTPPGGLDLFGVDLTDAGRASEAVAAVVARFGGIDILVNVAGGFVWERLADGGIDTWDRMMALNLKTAANMSKAALPYVEASAAGRIVNIGAAGGLQAAEGTGAYAASKSAVHRLTESLAAEAGKSGAATVNAVLPSIIDTPANRADMPKADFSRWVSPDAIADAILFLASPAARALNGALIPLTRGG